MPLSALSTASTRSGLCSFPNTIQSRVSQGWRQQLARTSRRPAPPSSAAMAGSAGGSVAVLTHHFHRVKKKLLGINIGYDSRRRTDEHQHGYSRMDNEGDDVVRNQAPVRLFAQKEGAARTSSSGLKWQLLTAGWPAAVSQCTGNCTTTFPCRFICTRLFVAPPALQLHH